MRSLALVLLLALSCGGDPDRPFPPGGGGGVGGVGGNIDGGLPPSDGMAAQLSGALCLIDDVREPLECASSSGIGGIRIEVFGDDIATTSANDGSFSMPSPGGASTQLAIAFGDPSYRDLLIAVDLVEGEAQELSLPLIPETTWQSLLDAVGITEQEGTASIASFVFQGDVPVSGAEAIAPTGSLSAPLYDGPNGPNDWLSGALTGDRGGILMLNVPVDSSNASFVLSSNQGVLDRTVEVVADVLTFVRIDLN